MSEQIVKELTFWVIYVFAGIAITFVYDLIRILRRVFKHPKGFQSFEDILFWMFSTVFLFRLLYQLNNGIIRWFAVFGLFCGMLFYKKIFSETFVCFMSTIIKRVQDFVVKVATVPLNLVKHAFLKGSRCVKALFLKIKKKLTGNIKKVNIDLCKHYYVNKKKVNGNKNEPWNKQEKEEAK